MSYEITANPEQKNITVTGEGLRAFSTVPGAKITDERATLPFTQSTAEALFDFLKKGHKADMSLRTKAFLRVLKDNAHEGKKDWKWDYDLHDMRDIVIDPKSKKMRTAWDLIHFMPLRYIDKTNPQNVTDLTMDTWSVVVGQITSIKYLSHADAVVIEIRDITGATVTAWFFRQRWLTHAHHEGDTIVLSGTFSQYDNKYTGKIEPRITNATIDPVKKYNDGYKVAPIYSEKGGKKKWITSKEVEKLVGNIGWIVDPVPEAIIKKYDLMSRNDAYRKIHFPDSLEEAVRARERIAFDDFVRLQVFLHQKKSNEQETRQGNMMVDERWTKKFIDSLPFEFTGAQKRVTQELAEDMGSEKPMRRLLHGDVGSGKAQPLYSKILTPTGFTTMGEIQVGDTVLTPNGSSSEVTDLFPQGKRPIYELTFRDGTKVHADAEHLWAVRTTTAKNRNLPHKLLRTTEIKNDLLLKNGYPKWYVDYPTVTDFGNEWASSIDPYLLGCLLGDGSISSSNGARFSAGEDHQDIVKSLSLLVERDFPNLYMRNSELRTNPNTGKVTGEYWFVKKAPDELLVAMESKSHNSENVKSLATKYPSSMVMKHLELSITSLRKITANVYDRSNPMINELKRLGLQGTNSHTKFIPEELLNSSYESRLALLQGLLDTDGEVHVGKAFGFCSVSKELAEAVAFLVRSLGGVARLVHKKRASGNSYQVSGRLDSSITPFRTSRKKIKYEAMKDRVPASKAIISVEYVGEYDAQCIKIADPNGLYITDDFTVTHNTEIALGAALRAARSGFQVALLAPTSILAVQLAERFEKDVKRAGLEGTVSVGLMHTGIKTAARRKLIADLKSGDLHILVGTHSILNKDIEFHKLGLIIIDEQHRFGTKHRQALTDNFMGKSSIVPDVLMMSATPIPRTMSQTIYGDMDLSVIDEYPADRKPVATYWDEDDSYAWESIREEVTKGHQAYVIASLVEESESEKMVNVENATQTQMFLQTSVFPDFKVGLVHGKMKPAEKSAVLDSFYANEIQVLVSTSVIEVGVNVPNATVMTILNANRFGIASLHQIRGRVGRGSAQGYCFLIAEATNPDAEERLNAMVASNDGFWLAEKDLEIRGEGSLMKDSQHGDNDMVVANLREHKKLLEIARRVAKHAAKSQKMQDEVTFLFKDGEISS